MLNNFYIFQSINFVDRASYPKSVDYSATLPQVNHGILNERNIVMLTEQWEPIKGYEGYYEISNIGRLKSLDRKVKCSKGELTVRGRLLKLRPDIYGYLYTNISKYYKMRCVRIHRLVWDTFGNKPRNGRKLQVDHIDGNKLNNRIDNLQLLSSRDNVTKSINKKNKTSQYTGVSLYRKGKRKDKWVSTISINGERKLIGYFNSEYEAHLAYQNKLKQIQT